MEREQVDFIFCDLDDREKKFENGCQALLRNSGTLYQRHAWTWTDWLMEQVVGTVVTTEQDLHYYQQQQQRRKQQQQQKRGESGSKASAAAPADENEDCAVFGFASLLDLSTKDQLEQQQDAPQQPDQQQERVEARMQALRYVHQYALNDCPDEYKPEMTQLLEPLLSPTKQPQSSSESKKSPLIPLFLFLHGRMMNLPLEIVLALHQQLWLDWEWDQEEEEEDPKDGKATKKKTNKQSPLQRDSSILPKMTLSGKIVEPRILRLAPCTKTNSSTSHKTSNNNKRTKKKQTTNEATAVLSQGVLYRYYDDELLADRAVVRYAVKAPPSYSQEEDLFLQVLVLTSSGYQQAIHDLEQMVGSA
ncbi:hypothetical protein ACA910_011395 [Epithemia clementina (nom. ined.)]